MFRHADNPFEAFVGLTPLMIMGLSAYVTKKAFQRSGCDRNLRQKLKNTGFNQLGGNTMQPETNKNLSIECYTNGRHVFLPFEEALQQVRQTEFAWLLPLDWYRYHVGKYAGEEFVYRVVPKSSRLVAYHLHRRGYLALTIDDLRELDEDVTYLERAAFHARIAKLARLFNALPLELRPWEYVDFLDPNNTYIPAYRMNPERTYIMVIGVAPDCKVKNEEVDWMLFMTPPDVP